MGYPEETLNTRTVIKPGLFAVIPPTGLVNNVIPGIEKCKVSIVASPKMGASFVQYVITAEPDGGVTDIFGCEQGIETFVYCVKGHGEIVIDQQIESMSAGSYGYAPPGVGLSFKNTGNQQAILLLYKQRYQAVTGVEMPAKVFGNTNDMVYRIYDEMENVLIKDLLPTTLAYDMNMHILSFKPGGCHPFVETHVQEHGAYILNGEGLYRLDDEWMPIRKDDFIWFGPYVAQGAYGVGLEEFTYIYSKDCNRDVIL